MILLKIVCAFYVLKNVLEISLISQRFSRNVIMIAVLLFRNIFWSIVLSEINDPSKQKRVTNLRVVLAWILQKLHGKFARPGNRRHDLLDVGNRVRFQSGDSIDSRFMPVRPVMMRGNYNYYYGSTVSYRFGFCVHRQRRFSKGSVGRFQGGRRYLEAHCVFPHRSYRSKRQPATRRDICV